MCTHRGLGRGGVECLGQLVGDAEAWRQGDSTDLVGCLIVFPTRADQIAAHNSFNRQWFESFHHHRAVTQPGSLGGFAYHISEWQAAYVIRCDVACPLKPK